MQRRISHNNYVRKFFCFWISGLMVISATAVMAEAVIDESDFSPAPALYLAQNVSGHYRTDELTPSRANPWSLPQPLAEPPEFQSPPEYYNPAIPGVSSGRKPQQKRGRAERFVTPEILESLKQQQQQYQTMPEKQRYYRYAPQQNNPALSAPGMLGPSLPGPGLPSSGFPAPGFPGMGSYGYPQYGTGNVGPLVDPLYDVPTVSPWGDDADILYRGESMPLVPNEAIGGFPPMPMPSFGMNNQENSRAGAPIENQENNVFNPFTFLPNRSLGEP